MNSQDSGTPTDRDIPTATPATSTPKPRSFRTATTPAPTASARTPSSSSSRGAMRPALMFSSSGEPQSATRKASLAMNTVVLGGKSRVVSTAQKTPLKTVPVVQNAPENLSNGTKSTTQQVAHKRAKVTANSMPNKGRLVDQKSAECTGSKSQARSRAEQTKKANEPNVKKIDVQAKQPSKLCMKKAQKSSTAVKKTVPQQPLSSKGTDAKVTSKKFSSRKSTSSETAKPTTKSTSAHSKKPTVKKSIREISDSPDPYDIPSPVLDYNLPTENMQEGHATAPGKRQNTSRSSNGSSRTVNNASKSILSDVTNQSQGATQLNRGGQHRVFNLSAAPMKRGKNSRAKTGRNSATSSLSSSPCLDEVNAIPDSMSCGPSSQKSMTYTSFLDDELELRPPTSSKQRKRIRIPTDHESFTFDSDNESDTSWKLAGDAKKAKKVAVSKPPTKRQYKATATKGKPKPMLTSARTKKVAANKKEQSLKAIANSKVTTTSKVARKTLDEDIENVAAKKTRPPTGTSLLERKRIIDDVYDPDFIPELNCPKPKITAPAAAKKALPKKKAPCTTAAKITEEPAKETPSLPSLKKDTAARKLIMIKDSPKVSSARKRAEVAKEVKKKQPVAKSGRKKQSTRTVDSPCAHDDLYYSPAIPRVSASKPDRAERAQSHNKPLRLESPKLDLHSPKLDPYGDDHTLVCPPSPKKPRLKQKGRRSSGYFSDTHAPSSPGYSDHGSLEELQNNIKANLQFADDELEHSRSLSPSSSPSPSPTRQPAPQVSRSIPPSPTSLHSSQVEADLNITANFEEICRQFISRSGKTGLQPSTTTAAVAKKRGTKRTKPSGNVATVAKKKRREQKNYWEDEEEGRDLPPPPPVVKVSDLIFSVPLLVHISEV